MSLRNDLTQVDLAALGTRPQAPAMSIFNRARGRKVEARDSKAGYEILIYDEIGYFGVSAIDVKTMLDDAAGRPVTLRINSPGGDVFDGFAIFNDLVAYPGEVTVEIVGLAASAASFIAMAGDQVVMAENSLMMIHRAWTCACGNTEFLHKMAEMTAEADQMMAGLYALHASDKAKDENHFLGLMSDETWLTPDEALAEGLIDSVGDQTKITARFDLSAFANVPKGLSLTDRQATAKPTKQDLVRALREAGLTRTDARTMLDAGQSAVQSETGGDDSADFMAALQQLKEDAQKGVQNHA